MGADNVRIVHHNEYCVIVTNFCFGAQEACGCHFISFLVQAFHRHFL
jgi:hypothetical protein